MFTNANTRTYTELAGHCLCHNSPNPTPQANWRRGEVMSTRGGAPLIFWKDMPPKYPLEETHFLTEAGKLWGPLVTGLSHEKPRLEPKPERRDNTILSCLLGRCCPVNKGAREVLGAHDKTGPWKKAAGYDYLKKE